MVVIVIDHLEYRDLDLKRVGRVVRRVVVNGGGCSYVKVASNAILSGDIVSKTFGDAAWRGTIYSGIWCGLARLSY